MRKRKFIRSIRWVAAVVLLVSALTIQALVLAAPEASAAGTGWYAQDAGDTGMSFQDVSVVDANIAWAAARDGWVTKTTDGGNTWIRKRGLPGG